MRAAAGGGAALRVTHALGLGSPLNVDNDAKHPSNQTTMAVAFTFDFDKARAALLYLASKELPAFDKGKACKLMFLVDKLHLVRYGRPITGDRYWALEHGPVPSTILNLLNNLESKDTADARVQLLAECLELDRTFENPRYRARQTANMDCLSRSDVTALDRVAEVYGSKTFAELRALTHETVAYQRAWNRKPSKKGAAQIAFEDFFDEDAESIAGAREEMLENDALRKSFPAR
jgi:uncharacterized phage-associated protein